MKGFMRQPESSKGQVTSLKDASLYQIVRYKGVFDLNELYRIVYDWLTSRGFIVHEHKYKAIKTPSGMERAFDWQAYREVTEFVMLHINVHWQIQDIQEIEIEKDGKKKKLQKARLLMRVQHSIELDWQERLAYQTWHQNIMEFMAKVMYKKKIDTLWEDKLRFKCYELVNVIKETLDFMTKGNEHYDVW